MTLDIEKEREQFEARVLVMSDKQIADLAFNGWLAAKCTNTGRSEPVHWVVHRVAKGKPICPDYAVPMGFFKKESADNWRQEQIDFNGWKDAWVQPLYADAPPSTDAKDASRWRLAIANEENAELLRAVVLSNAPDMAAIVAEFDAGIDIMEPEL
jgi:hypothetical protein